jgi:hypothetical protein
MICLDCKKETQAAEDKEPLCYGCLYNRYIAYKAENDKNFRLLCETEERLARLLHKGR